MEFIWFILFALIVAIVGGVLNANYKAKKENKNLDKQRNYTTQINGRTYHRNILERPVADIELKESIHRLEEAKAINRKWEQCFKHIGELSTKGSILEKSGQISSAILAYEKAVEYGEITPELNFSNYARDIDRLVILYRKEKDYQKETSLLKRALTNDMHPNHRSSYEQRLRKAEELLTKNSL